MAKYIKKIFDVKEPLPVWHYLLLVLLLFITVLALAALISSSIYFVTDISEKYLDRGILYLSRKHFAAVFVMVVAMIASMTGLVGPAIAIYWSIHQDKRNLVNLSYDFLKEWREEKVPSAMYKINDYFAATTTIEEASNSLYNYTLTKEGRKLSIAVRTLLNYFESLSAACNNEHVDVEVIQRYFEAVFIKYNTRLAPYIRQARETQGIEIKTYPNRGFYYDFTSLAEKWGKPVKP